MSSTGQPEFCSGFKLVLFSPPESPTPPFHLGLLTNLFCYRTVPYVRRRRWTWRWRWRYARQPDNHTLYHLGCIRTKRYFSWKSRHRRRRPITFKVSLFRRRRSDNILHSCKLQWASRHRAPSLAWIPRHCARPSAPKTRKIQHWRHV